MRQVSTIWNQILSGLFLTFVLSGEAVCQQQMPPYHNLLESKSPAPVIIYENYFDPGQDTSWFLGTRRIGPFNNPGNLWQIGRPLKQAPLNSTLTPPNVLITDTANFYPINASSSFELHFGRSPGYEWSCWSHMQFAIVYKIDVDSARDGIFIEIMYNGDGNWKNIILDDNADLINGNWLTPNNTYSLNDTLFNGEPGISFFNPHTYESLWNFSAFIMTWNWDDENAFNVDSVSFRMTFISDSINTGKGGFLIEDVYFNVDNRCGASINDISKSTLRVFPNPICDESVILFEKQLDYKIRISDVFGRVFYNEETVGQLIPIGRFCTDAGVFFYSIETEENSYQGKFIVNPK